MKEFITGFTTALLLFLIVGATIGAPIVQPPTTSRDYREGDTITVEGATKKIIRGQLVDVAEMTRERLYLEQELTRRTRQKNTIINECVARARTECTRQYEMEVHNLALMLEEARGIE